MQLIHFFQVTKTNSVLVSKHLCVKFNVNLPRVWTILVLTLSCLTLKYLPHGFIFGIQLICICVLN